jgi:hypothetical protein
MIAMTVEVHCGDDGDHRGSGLDVDRSRRQVGLGGQGIYLWIPSSIRFLISFMVMLLLLLLFLRD